MHEPRSARAQETAAMDLDDSAFNDPITLEKLVCPVLASDGITYSLESLQAAMAADAWHRSPVTGDVLRDQAFPNGFVADWLDIITVSAPVCIYTSAPRLPVDAREFTLTLPVAIGAEECLTRSQWQLPIQPVSLRVTMRRTELGEWFAMHAPPALNAFSAFSALAMAFGLGFAKNPAHITDAMLTFDGLNQPVTVEQWFLQHYSI